MLVDFFYKKSQLTMKALCLILAKPHLYNTLKIIFPERICLKSIDFFKKQKLYKIIYFVQIRNSKLLRQNHLTSCLNYDASLPSKGVLVHRESFHKMAGLMRQYDS